MFHLSTFRNVMGIKKCRNLPPPPPKYFRFTALVIFADLSPFSAHTCIATYYIMLLIIVTFHAENRVI